jgi:diguanylate cyclase (GGDEF)-like protein
MREIRLRWSEHVSHAGHEIEAHRHWAAANVEKRRDLAIIARTANDLYGPRSHWVEEREARQPDRDARLRYDQRVLDGDADASPYARQLAARFASLRFEPALEHAYRADVIAEQRPSAFVCMSIGMMAWLARAVVTLFEPMTPVAQWSRWVAVAVLGMGLLALHLRPLRVRTDHVSMVSLATMATVSCLQVPSGSHATPLPVFHAALVCLVFATFLPIGLVFRQSLPIAVGVALAGTLAGWGDLRSLAVLWGATLLASVTGYLKELAHRERFLMQELLSRQTYVDPLTGLYSRQGMARLTQTVRLQAIRDGATLSFVYIDIDPVETEGGGEARAAGDNVVVDVARTITAFARRPLDVASREGDWRFGLLLYDCTLAQARLHAERLYEALRALRAAHGDGDGETARSLGVSMGVVQVLQDEKAAGFLARAEELLQQSRGAARDRFTIY